MTRKAADMDPRTETDADGDGDEGEDAADLGVPIVPVVSPWAGGRRPRAVSESGHISQQVVLPPPQGAKVGPNSSERECITLRSVISPKGVPKKDFRCAVRMSKLYSPRPRRRGCVCCLPDVRMCGRPAR